MAFHWDWCSQKGKARTENQDFAGVAYDNRFLFAVIADGVFSRPRSGELAQKLVHRLVDRAIEMDGDVDVQVVKKWIEDVFYELKDEKSAKSSASFLAAGFLEHKLVFVVHAGDCRVGTKNEKKQVVWKNHVHSLATAIEPLSELALCAHPARNQLTRIFSTKRYVEPDITELDHECLDGAVLVSDGFWAGLPMRTHEVAFNTDWTSSEACDDDASRLLIEWKPDLNFENKAAANFYVRRK